jgi:diacylglycerol kinase family enzyme
VRVEVLVNAAAGSVDEADDESEVAAIEAAFRSAGIAADAHVVAPADFARRMHELWSAEPRPDALVAAGGDGTVSCAAQVAAGTDMVLGVLPLGTFDHFAKDLGMPTGLDEAVRALADAQVQAIDVAEVNGRTFVNNSVLGSYPAMVAIRDRIRAERGWGKVRAVPVASLRVLRHLPVHRLALEGPGFRRDHVRTPFVFIGNGVYENAGFGRHRREELADGLLSVAVARVVSRWGLVRLVVRALTRGADDDRDVDVVELDELVVRSRSRRIRVALDGEVCWLDGPLRYRCRPGALRVLVPPET